MNVQPDWNAAWAALAVELLLILASVIGLVTRMNTKSEEHEKAIAEERKEREDEIKREREDRMRAEQETRALAQAAANNFALLNERMLKNLTDEVMRVRHDVNNLRMSVTQLSEQTARADGRREAFEELVKRLLDAQMEK